MFIINALIVTFFILMVQCYWFRETRPLEIELVSNIIGQFNDYNIIFHYDDFTANFVDKIIAKSDVKCSTLMLNYETYEKEIYNYSETFERPTGYKFLHLVLLQNYSRLESYSISSRFTFDYLDLILVVINLHANNITAAKPFNIFVANVYRAGAFFILDVWDKYLYTVCFYCGNKMGIWQQLLDISQAHVTFDYFKYIRFIILYVYKKQFQNFNGHTFAIGYVVYEPFFWCYITVEGNETWFQVLGSEGSLLYVLHEKLNINYYMVNVENNENVSAQLLELVQNYTVDWAIGGITSTLNRMEHFEFTTYINTEPYVILYSINENRWMMSWKNVLTPFQMSIWFCIFLIVILISSMLFATMVKTNTKAKMEFRYYIQGLLRLLVEQPLPCIRATLKSRWTTMLLMTLWLFVALLLTNAYKSKLTSSLISSKTEEYTNVDDLLHLGYNFYINKEDTSAIEEYLESSEDNTFLEVLKRSTNDKEFCSSILSTFDSNIAIIDEETNIQYLIQENCRQYMTLQEQQNLRLLKHDLFSSQHAWPLRKNSPYRNTLNSVISRLHAAGLFIKWNNDYASTAQKVSKSYEKRSKNYQSSRKKFNLTSLIGPIFIWLFGLIISFVIFIIELIKRRN